jgi:hypothetical protein
MPDTWDEVVSAKRANRDALIKTHQTSRRTAEHNTYITDISDVDALQKLLEARKVSAEEIILAYIQK